MKKIEYKKPPPNLLNLVQCNNLKLKKKNYLSFRFPLLSLLLPKVVTGYIETLTRSLW